MTDLILNLVTLYLVGGVLVLFIGVVAFFVFLAIMFRGDR